MGLELAPLPSKAFIICDLRVGSPEADPKTRMRVNVIVQQWRKDAMATVVRKYFMTDQRSRPTPHNITEFIIGPFTYRKVGSGWKS